MWYLIAFVTLLFVGLLDGHTSSMMALLTIYILGLWSVNTKKGTAERIQGGTVFGIVFSVYVISALIASQSFLEGQSFFASDPAKYIEKYSNIKTWSWDDALSVLELQYFYFDDNNGLYNEGLTLWAYRANYYFDGTTVFYMTLLQTMFGVLASLEIFKIFVFYFNPHKAAKYACTFAILSLFHIYSTIIIRDIVIAYFYMLGLRKIISGPRLSDAVVLLLVLIVTTGIRLYTGLFFGAFVMLWAYMLVQDTKYANLKIIFVPLIVLGIVFVGASFGSSMLMESTEGQLGYYDDFYSEESGVASKLRALPVGLRQVVILFFSQLPLDNFHKFSISNSFSNYYLSILAIIYKFFGFVIFYGLMYYSFIMKLFKKMEIRDKWIWIIMLVFIALNLSTHMDARRSMEAIPFIFLYYTFFSEKVPHVERKKINNSLLFIGALIMLVYTFVS